MVIASAFITPPSVFLQDVVSSLKEKLCLNAIEHFSLVLEHVKSLKRNKLTLLDSQQTLVKVRNSLYAQLLTVILGLPDFSSPYL